MNGIQDKKKSWIQVIGAREHNLKNIDVAIPKESLTVITGPSGSGKSSLALDVLFTEGKRRYMESLSSYTRQFLGIAKKPDVDRIDGLCPAIAIEQKTVGNNPRSTVGTITEIFDYLRVLYARIGQVVCPTCALPLAPLSAEQVVEQLKSTFYQRMITIAAPIVQEKKGEFVKELTQLFKAGLYRFVIDGQRVKLHAEDDIKALKLKKTYKHTIDALIDVVDVHEDEQARLVEAVERAFKQANGVVKIIAGDQVYRYSSHAMCTTCQFAAPDLEPRLFSFNSPIGACAECHGLGLKHKWPWGKNDPDAWKSQYPDFFGKYAQEIICTSCAGKRLSQHALSVKVGGVDIMDLSALSIKQLVAFFNDLSLSRAHHEIAHTLVTEIQNRLQFLFDVGLGYLTLQRKARTLSGGEGQRIRLATQIGSALSGVLYILDEPSIGLHQRDNDRLIRTLQSLRDQGNTVVVVEHDIDTMRAADYLIDMGPAAGVLGGQVTAVGTPDDLARNRASLSGAYLSGKREIKRRNKIRTQTGELVLKNVTKNNLQDVSVSFPLGVMCGISGVSGSGKSSLVMQALVPAIQKALDGYVYKKSRIQEDHDVLVGVDQVQSLVVIDQSPIGRTPRSNPATYLGIFDHIRKLYASLPESNARGYAVGRFSFNVADGRCFECKGDGTITVEMHFLPEVTVICKSCRGRRYNAETLSIRYKGKNIADILDMTAYEALSFFAVHPTIAKRLQLLCDVGLDYLKLGQSSQTLSGGEAQRIKLVDELAKRGNQTLYVLDEPTTGLHTSDIEKLLTVLNTLIDKGNSMIIIEHNIDVLKTVDHIIDMGPEGGDEGGYVVATGTPEDIAACAESHTGTYLKQVI